MDTDISFVSSNRSNMDQGPGFCSPFNRNETGSIPRLSFDLDNRSNFVSPLPSMNSSESSYARGFSSRDDETPTSYSSSNKVGAYIIDSI